MGKLEGKVAIVTGASRGIGAEIARVFAAEGARVACVARTLKEGDHPLEGSLETTCNAIEDAGGKAAAVVANISWPEDCERLVEETRTTYGPVDVLVNNAALAYFMAVREYPLNKWKRSWSVNIQAPFLLSQLVLEDMISSGGGSIVNISGGARGPGRGPYSDSNEPYGGVIDGTQKAALERFTQGLALEVYQHGVSVTAVAPSLVVPTPGTIYHKMVSGLDDPNGEHPNVLAQATLLLATEPLDKVTGRVTYSQQILKEFGWIADGKGIGVDPDVPGSGYSEI